MAIPWFLPCRVFAFDLQLIKQIRKREINKLLAITWRDESNSCLLSHVICLEVRLWDSICLKSHPPHPHQCLARRCVLSSQTIVVNFNQVEQIAARKQACTMFSWHGRRCSASPQTPQYTSSIRLTSSKQWTGKPTGWRFAGFWQNQISSEQRCDKKWQLKRKFKVFPNFEQWSFSFPSLTKIRRDLRSSYQPVSRSDYQPVQPICEEGGETVLKELLQGKLLLPTAFWVLLELLCCLTWRKVVYVSFQLNWCSIFRGGLPALSSEHFHLISSSINCIARPIFLSSFHLSSFIFDNILLLFIFLALLHLSSLIFVEGAIYYSWYSAASFPPLMNCWIPNVNTVSSQNDTFQNITELEKKRDSWKY